MSDAATWERGNDAYLAAVLTWVRLLLERSAGDGAGRALPVPAVPAEPSPPPPRRRLFRAELPEAGGGASGVPAPAPAPGGSTAGARLEDAARAVEEAAAATDPPPALVLLARRFGLSDFESDVLLLCVALDLAPNLAALCAKAQGDSRLAYPTFALALGMFDEPTWEPLLPDRPLRRYNLIEVYQPPTTPLTMSALRADERIVGYAKGVSYLDDRLAPLLVALDDQEVPESPLGSQAHVVDDLVTQITRANGGPLPVVQMLGADAPSKELLARLVGDRLALSVHRLPYDLMPTDVPELERFARLWERESVLAPRALFLDSGGSAPAPDGRAAALSRLLTRTHALTFLDSRDVVAVPGRTSLVVEVERPSAAEQEQAWRAALGPEAEPTAATLANQFNLGLPTIERIARSASASSDGSSTAERAWSLCLVETRRGLDALAQRVEAKAGWDDIVLPEQELQLLHRIADQVQHRRRVYEDWGFSGRTSRGLGINALFAGPSGTGKTMAAEVIARHLDLNLYRIDLSAVVSKYIGETEKNLARVFDEAEHRGVVLHFDECDALFGKRTEVRDSHDRYANIESSFLLQRIEAFEGLAILATNMKSALDPAFIRRLRFVVNFPYPSPAERTLIWEKVFPSETQTEGLDAARLGRLNFTGGNIFTIAMNAAFLAAGDSEPVGMRHVLDAARAETRKLDRPVSERDFVLPREGVPG